MTPPLYLFPAAAGLISILNGVYAFGRRRAPGALYFFLMPIGTALWSGGYCLELLGSDQASMTVWDNFEFIGSDLVVIGFFFFAWHYTRQTRPPLWLFAFPVLNQIMAWTDHGLVRVAPHLSALAGGTFLVYDYGPYMWANVTTYYVLLFASGALFVSSLRSSKGIFRRQIVLMLLSGLIPWAASTLTVFGLLPIAIPNLDISPPGLAAANLILTGALFWTGTLRIAPIARARTFELMEDGVLVSDPENRILDFNAAARRILAADEGFAYGGEVPGFLLAAAGEVERKMGSGSTWLQVRKTRLLSDDQTPLGFLYTLHDITAYKQAQEALRVASEQALNASKAKSIFLANVSHEIRTPLTAIIGIAEILQSSRLDEEQRAMVESFRTAGQSLLSTINDLLDLSRIEAGKMKLDERDFDPRELLENTCNLFRLQIAAGKHPEVSLELRISGSMPARLRGDDLRINQILTNLVGNSVKFTNRGLIQVDAGFEAGTLILTVADTGIGIPPAKLEGIFKAFEQADPSTTRAFGGTGLGLTIVRELVRLLDGIISVRSEPGRGSEFAIRIPVLAAQDEKTPEESMPAEIQGRILLAEDTDVIRLVLAKYLTSMGLAVVVTENGQQAVERLQNDHFDAAILDIQMPVMDGYEAARNIRTLEKFARKPRMPLIALSASAMPEDIANSREAGFDMHVAKPVSSDQLKSALQKALSARRTQGTEN